MPVGNVARRVAMLGLVAFTFGGPLVAPDLATATARDSDGDGLTNTFERWRSLTNPRRVDTDRDGISDGREDPDRDRLTNLAEQNLATNPRLADTDRDGWTDGAEYRAGTDPRSSTSRPRPPKPKPTPTPGATPTPAPTPTPSPGPSPTPSGGSPTLPGARGVRSSRPPTSGTCASMAGQWRPVRRR